MILSDVTIREELAAGRIVIDPLGDQAVQPSSVDLHVDRYFRVFRNDTTPYIDPKQHQEDLTELVEVGDGGAFILHPGEFVLGSTLERVALPDDLVARLEGKSSLGRLGLLIHSSLPASETVMVLDDGVLRPRPVGEVVRKQLQGYVVGFDPDTFAVGYPRDHGVVRRPRRHGSTRSRCNRVDASASPRATTSSRSTGMVGLKKVRTGELRPGVRVAVPRRIPDPEFARVTVDLLDVIPESEYANLVCTGPTVRDAFVDGGDVLAQLLRDHGYKHTDYYAQSARLPFHLAAQVDGLFDLMGRDDRILVKGSRTGLPRTLLADRGVRVVPRHLRGRGVPPPPAVRRVEHRSVDPRPRRGGVARSRSAHVPSAERGHLHLDVRVERAGVDRRRREGHEKRIPPMVFAWPTDLLEAFLEGAGRRRRQRRRHPHVGLDDLGGPGRRPVGAVRPTRPSRRHLLARPRPRADLPGLHADA